MYAPDPSTTLGVEEEFHLVDPDRRVLVPAALDTMAAAARLGVVLDPEFHQTSIETATAVCRSLGQVRRQLVERRRDAARAAAEAGAVLMACGTVPMPGPAAHPVYPDDRFRWMAHEFGRVAAEHQICSCQVQVGVADRELAVGVLNRDDAVLVAGIGRALVTTAAREVLAHGPADDARVELLRSAMWRAARSGLTAQLVDPVTWAERPAAEVVAALMDHIAAALHDSGDDAEVGDLVGALLSGGTAAQAQRAVYSRGSGEDVVDWLLQETAAY